MVARQTWLRVETVVKRAVGCQYARTLDTAWTLGTVIGAGTGMITGSIMFTNNFNPRQSAPVNAIRIVGITSISCAAGAALGMVAATAWPITVPVCAAIALQPR